MTTETMLATDAKINFGAILDRALRGGATIIQRYSRPAAVMIGYDEYERLLRLEADTINQRSAEIRAGKYETLDQVRDGLGS